MNKKGVSPIIATVILIAIGVVLAGIIFTWGNAFFVSLSPPADCGGVNFEAGIFEGKLEVVNEGNIPLYGFEIRELGVGETIVRENVGGVIVNVGESVIIDLKEDIGAGKILIIPVVLAESVGGEVEVTCDNRFGVEIDLDSASDTSDAPDAPVNKYFNLHSSC